MWLPLDLILFVLCRILRAPYTAIHAAVGSIVGIKIFFCLDRLIETAAAWLFMCHLSNNI